MARSRPARGISAIRKALAEYVAMKPTIQLTTRRVVQEGDTALLMANWRFHGTTSDGGKVSDSGTSIEVARRQPDGSWRYLIISPTGSVNGLDQSAPRARPRVVPAPLLLRPANSNKLTREATGHLRLGDALAFPCSAARTAKCYVDSESWRALFHARIRSGLRAWNHSHTVGGPEIRHENG